MIPCPSCGVRNRRGSKYCYRCGQRLDVAFDVSCPACDRLNPAGSAFCAFCGAAIASVLPAVGSAVAEEPSVARQPEEAPHSPLDSKPPSVEPVAEPQRELPSWLYEQADERSAAGSATSAGSPTSTAEPPLAQGKYLDDIPGALPKTEGWLSSVVKSEKPAETQSPQSKPKGLAGCLTLALAALLAAAGLVLSLG
jgi:hypothetical protein